MWKKKEDFLKYHRSYVTKRQQRWRKIGCCIDCGLPCAPYWRCLKHRVRASAYSRNNYRKKHPIIKRMKKKQKVAYYQLSLWITHSMRARIHDQLKGRKNQSDYVRKAIEIQLLKDEQIQRDKIPEQPVENILNVKCINGILKKVNK